MTSRLELRATHLQEIALELAHPSLPLSDLDPAIRRRLPSGVAQRWSDIQALVAKTIGEEQPVTTDPELSQYVAAVTRQRSYLWCTLTHEAADQDRFRADLTDNVGGVIGVELAANLVRRPMSVLVADAHPFTGWAANHELRVMMAALDPEGIPARHEQTVDLNGFLTCIRAAVDRGYDLVTIYDGASQTRANAAQVIAAAWPGSAKPSNRPRDVKHL